jgi:hypothetical protein
MPMAIHHFSERAVHWHPPGRPGLFRGNASNIRGLPLLLTPSRAILLTESEGWAMQTDPMPGTSNVLRFPVERRARPTLDLLREIAPDLCEVLVIVEDFRLEPPTPDLREQADASAAEYVVDQFAGLAVTDFAAALQGLLEPVVARAVDACRAAYDLGFAASTARHAVWRAQADGGYWLDPLRERAEALSLQAAEALLHAHLRAEEAFGVARAVDLARRGLSWTPRDRRAEAEGLFAPGGARLLA